MLQTDLMRKIAAVSKYSPLSAFYGLGLCQGTRHAAEMRREWLPVSPS